MNWPSLQFPSMQQELWLRAKSQVLTSLKAVCAMRAASSHPPPPPPLRHAYSEVDGQTCGPDPLRPSQLRTRASNSVSNNSHGFAYGHTRENANKTSSCETPQNLSNPVKASRSHQELHRELLMAHRKGLAVCCKPELQMVLERRKREQTQREEGEQCRSDLEQVLLRRQQKQQEVMREKEQEEKIHHEIQLLEFIRVRQNLKKVHSALQKNNLDQ